jgi:uncharacterized membrane protein/glutaredoxin
MIQVTLYRRKDCSLCDQVKADLERIQKAIPHEVVEIDIDTDAKLVKKYGLEIPVVVAGPYTLKAPIEVNDLEITLKAAQYRQDQIDSIDQKVASGAIQIPVIWTKSDSLSYWLSHHYLALFNLFIAFYLGFAFFAPIMLKIGWTAPASWVYRAYGMMCHQLAFRSYFLFGEQAAYPRFEPAGSGLLDFQQATGIANEDLWGARQFLGNSVLGFKVALCERDVAIYLGILIFGLLYALTGRKIKALPWYLWILIGLVPIGLDGFSQLLSQPPFNLWAYRESTALLRSITGFLFGFSTAWFGYPMAERAMRETLEYLEAKKRRIYEQQKRNLAAGG